MSAFKNTVRVYRALANGAIVPHEIARAEPAPTQADTLALCETIVGAIEARAECNAWLSGQALMSRISALGVS
jgi:hypothetical protein